jgi:hypothetical protein
VTAAYRAGESQLLDFLDGQRAYSRALFDYRLSLFELDAAVGVTSRGSRP